jgi:hypothetical protein
VPGDLAATMPRPQRSVGKSDVPTVADMAARIDGLRAVHELLVLERDDQIVGFAYGQPLRRLTERSSILRAPGRRTIPTRRVEAQPLA